MSENKVSKGDLKQELFNTVNENVRALEVLFPTVVKDGQVDFEALKEELGLFEEVGEEKYGLTWAGKQNAKKIAQEDIVGRTLKFEAEESKDKDTTENLYIEGDNLEALKLLRQNYYGAIKVIYIDPPYNTGNDYIYKDNFKMDKDESEFLQGYQDDTTEKFTINPKNANKFHANWLNMMYSRLKIAKDLLAEDGVIFISIDDNEVANLRKLCEDTGMFGEQNFIADLIWQKKTGASDAKGIAVITEHILVYMKNKNKVEESFSKNTESYDLKRYRNSDVHLENRGPYYIDNLDRGGLQYSDSLNYGVECPDGTIAYPNGRTEFENDGWIWKWSKQKLKWAIENDFVEFRKSQTKNSGWAVCYKNYLWGEREGNKIERAAPHKNLITNILNANAASDLKNIFNENIFSYSKPVELVKTLLSLVALKDNDIVLDFFSGSGTTAHAVLKLNDEQNKSIKYIMIQLQEEITASTNSKAYRFLNDLKKSLNICEIGKERIRRVGANIADNNSKVDVGFKVFKIGDTNIRWNYQDIKERTVNLLQQETQLQIVATQQMTNTQLDIESLMKDKDNLDFMPEFTDIDVVYEILLRQRDIPLSAKVEQLKEVGERTYLFAQSYLVCLETEITTELLEKIATLQPLPIKFIFRDSAFEDDINLKDETIRRFKAFVARTKGEKQSAYTVEFI